jgi:hypothetical protein
MLTNYFFAKGENMSTYTVQLEPALVNLASEGSLDTAIDASGHSIQRTMNAILVKSGGNYKMVGHLKDGDTFTDTVEGVGDYPNIVS